jgi:hypothetical protein
MPYKTGGDTTQHLTTPQSVKGNIDGPKDPGRESGGINILFNTKRSAHHWGVAELYRTK